jgi:hypothetical protein
MRRRIFPGEESSGENFPRRRIISEEFSQAKNHPVKNSPKHRRRIIRRRILLGEESSERRTFRKRINLVVIRGKIIRTNNDTAKNYAPPGKKRLSEECSGEEFSGEELSGEELSERRILRRRIILAENFPAKNHPGENCSGEEYSALTKKNFSEELSDEESSWRRTFRRRIIRRRTILAKNYPSEELSGEESSGRKILRRRMFRFREKIGAKNHLTKNVPAKNFPRTPIWCILRSEFRNLASLGCLPFKV